LNSDYLVCESKLIPIPILRMTGIAGLLCGKGIVQQKVRWVESGVNQWLVLQYSGVGSLFLILMEHHLRLCKKRLAAILAQIIGNVGEN
jgi:hypothetical protein